MAPVPIYHSLPGAPASLYLDFDGHFEPSWAGHSNVITPVYDSDGDDAIYNAAELAFIEDVWKVVAEDFAPFNIDVTTEQPPVLAAGVPIGQANGVALRVAIGGSSTDWYGGTWAGVAHQDSFTNAIVNTAYAFSVFEFGVDTNPVSLARAISHEAGHAFGLAHQSQYNASGVKIEEYLPPTDAWAAIMGAGSREHATWHNGPSAAGATVFQDDMAIIGRAANGFGLRADDHGNTIASATTLGGSGPHFTAAGLIGATTDVDMFSFALAAPREMRIALNGPPLGQNLDAVLEVYNAQGALVAMANPADSLDAVLQQNFAPGTYHVAVKSDGRYGRVGQYSLAVGPIVSVSVSDLAITEGDTGQRNAAFVVSLSDPMNEAVTLSYTTADGTASAASDYVARSGAVTFSPGVMTQTVNIALAGDTIFEPNEHFFFRLAGATNVTLADGEAVGTILNDDDSGSYGVSAEEQLFVYLVNRARRNPVAFQQEHGLPVDLSTVESRPPLAVHEDLFASARFHADEMTTHNYFAHQSPVTGDWPNRMAREHGYPLPAAFLDNVNNIESIAAGTARDTAQEVLTNLIGDSSAAALGHRSLLLGIDGFANYREIGVGHSFNAASDYDHYWSIQTAYASTADRFLTGVVYEDRNGNARYDLNEGLAGVSVTALLQGGGLLTAETNSAGGWSIKAAAPGTYSIVVGGGQFTGEATEAVNASSGSIAIDFISGSGRGVVDFDRPQIVAPGGLVASAAAPNRVRLDWTDNSPNEAGFRIERSTDGVNFATLADVAANITGYDDAGLQSNITYYYRVRGLSGPVMSGTSNVAATTPQLIAVNGTEGNDTYYVIRSGSFLHIYENTAPSGSPTYLSALAAMSGTLTINTLGGNDTVTVSTPGQSLGVGQLIYNAGAGANSLVLERGSAQIDATAVGGTLNTSVGNGANLTTARLQQNNLTLGENSKVSLLPGGGTSVVTSLTLASTAVVDIGDNAMVINYGGASPVATVRARILAGRGGPGLGASWTGAGITSSTVAQANAANAEAWSIGYSENAALPLGPYANFGGVAVDATSILIAPTRTGDANLDGLVNDDDVTIVGATFAPTVAQAHWAMGDFDYNGFVGDDDVTLLGVFHQPATGAAPAPTPVVVAADVVVARSPELVVARSPDSVVAWSPDSVVAWSPDSVVAWSPDSVVAWSPDHATLSTAGLPAPRTVVETFGRVHVRGQAFDELNQAETRAQPETRAQFDDSLLEMLAATQAVEPDRRRPHGRRIWLRSV
jgi:uncharacterized protein YkwD